MLLGGSSTAQAAPCVPTTLGLPWAATTEASSADIPSAAAPAAAQELVLVLNLVLVLFPPLPDSGRAGTGLILIPIPKVGLALRIPLVPQLLQ
jgi:hypothetical protein